MPNPFVKASGKPYVPGTSPEFAEQNNELKADAIRKIIRSGLLGLATGAGGSALLALPSLIRGTKVPSYQPDTDVELPYPQPVNKLASLGAAAIDAGANVLGGGAFGAGIEKHKAADPMEGSLYGGAHGAIKGLGAFGGSMLGHAGGQALSARVGGGPNLRQNLAAILPILGGVGGSFGGWEGGKAVANKMTGPKPKPKKPKEDKVEKTEKKADFSPGYYGNMGGYIYEHAGKHFLKDGPPESFPGAQQFHMHMYKPENHGHPPRAKKTEKKADLARGIVDNFLPTRPGQAQGGMRSWLAGDTHSESNAIPWSMPGNVLAGAGGALGGGALVHYLLKKHRKSNLDSELAAAQKEYDEAMLSQYDPEKLRNISSVKAASSKTNLDVCFDVLEKKGFLDSVNNAAGQGAGAYLTLASLLGIGSALGTKKWLDSRSGEKTLTDALKRRAMIRQLQNPADVHVKPVPVEYVDGEDQQ